MSNHIDDYRRLLYPDIGYTRLCPILAPISGVACPGISDIGPDIDTDIECRQILCPILTSMSGVAGPDIGIPDIGIVFGLAGNCTNFLKIS